MSGEDKDRTAPVEEGKAVLRAMPTEPAAADAYDVPVAPAASAEDAAAARAQRLKEADEIFAAAKRLAADCDYAAAAELLSTVLETRCDIYGQLAVECREAYILYGKCLLLSVKSTHGLDAVLAQSNKIAAAKQRAADAAAAGDEGAAAAAAAAAAAPVAEVDDDESGITDTLENAWECLEVARVVCPSFRHLFSCLCVCHAAAVLCADRSRRSTRPTRSSSRTCSWTSATSASRAVCPCTSPHPLTYTICSRLVVRVPRQRKARAGGLHQVSADPQEPAAQQRPPHRRGVCNPVQPPCTLLLSTHSPFRCTARRYYVMGLALSMLPECQHKSREHFALAKASLEERIAALKPDEDASEIDELRGLIQDIDRHVCLSLSLFLLCLSLCASPLCVDRLRTSASPTTAHLRRAPSPTCSLRRARSPRPALPLLPPPRAAL